ncbi:MAG: Ig-like domain-containing protein, partial [Burkholderiales bacterium]|nr:Ig-like domain-containing protein [Burkholderiales bacterium]
TTLTYSISGGADAAKFAINATTGALTFVAAPNFEAPTDVGANNVYDVTVQVSDGATTDTQAIAVTVTNVNDNTPVITSNGGGATAAASVAENTTAVTTVTATDADAGTTLTYSISGGADAAKFAINATSGVLTFVAAPDFEAPTDVGANNIYDVTVQVSDGATTDTQAIAVTVTDVGALAITSNGGGAAATPISVAENTTAVTTVTAVSENPITYSIVAGGDGAKFAINATTGALTFVAAPNFEAPTDVGANNVYDLTVQASDGATTDTQTIAVTVTNVNEAPVITSNGGGATAAASVAENATAVTTVTATDADAGATLTYSISGGADAAKFAINSGTGALTFLVAPDFETPTDVGGDNVYDVTVQVSDGVTTDTQAIAVTVTDVGALAITSNGGGAAAALNVAENATAVTTVTAVSENPITYSIVVGGDGAKFAINPTTGVLTFVAPPDFEAPTDGGLNNVYDVTVQADDGATTDTQTIAVTVTDLDEIALAPSAPDLAAASDSGSSSTDNITNDTTPTVTGTGAEAGATVTLYDTDGTTVLGTGVADGAGAWSITSTALAQGAHTLTAKQTDLAGNVSVASAGLAITVDTTAPFNLGASFVGQAVLTTTDLTMSFSESVTAGIGDVTLIRNPSWINNGTENTVTVNSVVGSGTSTLTLNITKSGSANFGGGGVVLVRFDATGNDVIDLAGNKVASREVYVGGNGDNIIDLSGYSSAFLQQLRGNGGNDLLIGTNAADSLVDGGGADILTGGFGGDTLTLTEVRSGTPLSDIIKIGLGESTASAMDVIRGSSTDLINTGFDMTSGTVANHDKLDLPSNVIAGDVTNANGTDVNALATHSITSGIITFQDAGNTPILINPGNLTDALAYLAANITTPGTTVAFKVDTDNSGTIVDSVDALYVFQDNGATDTVLRIESLAGVASATLGTAAGANVVQLVSSVPTVDNVTSSTGNASYTVGATISILVTFSEAVTVTGTPQLTLETGTTDRTVNYISGSGTATLVFNYTVQAGDTSADLDYLGTTALSLNGGTIMDAAGVDVANLTLPAPGAAGSLSFNKALVVDAVAAPPSTPDLAAASDSGSSNTDNITNDTTPTLTGTAEAGATVTLYDTDGTTVLGTNVADGGGAWTITSSVLAAGPHTLTAKQTDLSGNVSVASVGLAITIDTTAPGITGATFTEANNSSITLSFSEAVTALDNSGLTLHKNPDLNDGQGGWASPTVITPTGASGFGTSTVVLTTATTLGATDVVRAYYNASGGNLTDLAGNAVTSRETWFGGNGASIIDLSDYGSSFPIQLRGNGGADILTGTNASDTLIDGGGTDTLTGGRGADIVVLTEVITSGTSQFSDTIVIGLGDSSTVAMDVIQGSSTNPTNTGFDISSTTSVANHDKLSLQSNVIAADTGARVNGADAGTIKSHTISSGIVTFYDADTGGNAVLINLANSTTAGAYLSANLNSPGTTVAFRVDGNSDGTVDSLVVFQDNGTIPLSGGYVVPDTLVRLSGLVGVASATLGTAAGANVVQLQDLTPPQPIGFGLTSNGVAINFAENAFATPASIALSLKQNGITDMAITGGTGSGTTALTLTTGTTLAATDWVLLNYTGTTVSNGLSDAAGNVLIDDPDPTYGGSAEGSSGNNTIDLSNAITFAATGGYDLNGAGGNDTLIATAGDDYLDGGTGADTMTGGLGNDYFGFEQGDSPAGGVNLGGNGILDNGDTFTFAGGVDRITDFASGEGFNLNALHQDLSGLPGVGWMGTQFENPANSVLPANGLATNQGFFLVQGNSPGILPAVGASFTFTVNNAGADTLVVWDGDSTGGVTQTGIVLSGVTLAQLNAYTGNNWISHM